MRKHTRRVGAVLMLCLLVIATAGHAEWIDNGIALAEYTGYQGDQDILADGLGGAFIVWQDSRNSGNQDVYAQRVDALGNELWTPGGVNVSKGLAGNQRSARMVSDGADGIIVVYEDNNAGNYDIKAQRLDGDGNLLWTNTIVMCSAAGDQRHVVVVEDGTGGAIVTWEDERSGDSDVYARRISSSGTQWAMPNGVPICVQPNSQGAIDAVGDGFGNTIIVWQDNRSGSGNDIYAQRISLAGVPAWTTNGVVICGATSWQYNPRVAPADNGSAIITWGDYRNTVDQDVYAQRVDSFGAVQWTADGVAIATGYGDQWLPAIAEDGSGGAIIAFTAYGGLNEDNIKAQRVDADGNTQWTSGGREVCGKAGVQEWSDIAPAPGGGAFITWEDNRWDDTNVNTDVYAQKIDGNGDPEWEIDGVAVARAAYAQALPLLTEADDGGCIVAWMDYRHGIGNWDLYCQRIDKSGVWGYMAARNLVVEDVPHDQGGYVTITWDASRSDTYAGGVVTSYAVYRSLTGPPSYNWQSRGSFIAVHQETYTYTDDTTADSTISGPAYHYYKVRAYTSIVDLYWDSLPDSGYSVDNTVPASPAAVVGEQRTDPPGLEITWLPNTDSDLAHYAVYRGIGGGFVPSPENRVGTPDEPAYFDGEWRWNTGYCYKVTAVDVHDNESAPASLLPDDVTGAGTRGVGFSNALYQNVPNPFNPSTRIAFEIRTASDVTLRVYDANGKLVQELVSARLAPGRYEEEWNGRTLGARRAASGVYFYKLTAGSFVETKKMILLK